MFNYVIEVFHKPLVVITQAYKSSWLIDIYKLGNLWNGLNLDLLNPPIYCINHVTQVFHLSLKKPTLGWMKFKVMFHKSSKHFLQMMHVISWGKTKNNDVIDMALSKTNTH